MSEDEPPFDPFAIEQPPGERLQKFLAAAGVASRRHAEVLIRQRRVTVNGHVAEVGSRVLPDDEVCVNGVAVGPQAPRYILLNKPTGVVTTADDPQGRTTVLDLVRSAVDERVYPVGRLDFETSGLLLMTNDGDLAHRMMHPSFGVEKTYRALVRGKLRGLDRKALADGVELEDGPTAPAKVRVLQESGGRSLVEITIHEGRNRQVRRMFDLVGNPVIDLARVKYGPLSLGELAPGATRALTDPEIRRLKKAAGMAPARHRDQTAE